MFTIRSEQMSSMHDYRLNEFLNRMAAHLRKFFPGDCEALGEAETLEIIKYGVRRARRHGISAERDLCKYLDLTFSFGRHFDTDPDLPWAARILQEPRGRDPRPRIDRLCEIALGHLDQARSLLKKSVTKHEP